MPEPTQMLAAASSGKGQKGKGAKKGRGKGKGSKKGKADDDEAEDPIVASHSDLVDTKLLAKIGSMEAASRIDIQHKRREVDEEDFGPDKSVRVEPLNTAVARMLKRASPSGEVQHYYKKDSLSCALQVKGRIFAGIGGDTDKVDLSAAVQQHLDYMPLYDATRSCFGGFPRMVKETTFVTFMFLQISILYKVLFFTKFYSLQSSILYKILSSKISGALPWWPRGQWQGLRHAVCISARTA